MQFMMNKKECDEVHLPVYGFNPFETYELLKLDHFPRDRVDN